MMRPLRILTWHIHGNYLYYLVHSHQKFYLPVKPGLPAGYAGRTPGFPWPENVHAVPAQEVSQLELDCILFQSRQNYDIDQYEILSSAQQQLPKIYLEHDPPREHPTDTQHWVNDPTLLLVHVTHFNHLMWNSGRTPTTVIEHGVPDLGNVQYTGELERGLVVVNNLNSRGRRLGADLFEIVRDRIPLDLIGMNSDQMEGLGEVSHEELAAFEARYRFFFNPIRYTSLGLAVCEAMMVGMPIVALATTEMVTVIENGISGFVDTNLDALVEAMEELLQHPEEARRLGLGAQQVARERFSLDRFASDWDTAFEWVAGKRLGIYQGISSSSTKTLSTAGEAR
ncbi:MAG: glycosyltransferase family 4 protein [Leptolyngbyaceae cyanobacterium bins.59]|nr:glycosyltransferase family 4 protein [Leptolyngbyaceae cyanobacterium bins.59]